MKRVKHLLILLCLCLYAGVSQAQVTFGGNSQPNSFSVLELISNQERGLRLPQLSTAQRNALVFSGKETTEAKGLMIYNTTTNCVETWNGATWISSCADASCEQAGADLTIKASPDWQLHVTGTFLFELETTGSISSLVVDWYSNGSIVATTEGTRFFTYHPGKFGRYVVQAKVRESCSENSDVVSNEKIVIVGCGAYTGENSWLSFMCHNLGADTSLDPFTPHARLHGAKYRFGAKEASLEMAADQFFILPENGGIIDNWLTYDYQPSPDPWKEEKDPCRELGWRLPTIDEWENVCDLVAPKHNLNPYEKKGERWVAKEKNFNNGFMIGKYLFLPAADYRLSGEYGTRTSAGFEGSYWSSDVSEINVSTLYFRDSYKPFKTSTLFRTCGLPVRCVEAKSE